MSDLSTEEVERLTLLAAEYLPTTSDVWNSELRRVNEDDRAYLNAATENLPSLLTALSESRSEAARLREALTLVLNSYDESGQRFIGSAEIRAARSALSGQCDHSVTVARDGEETCAKCRAALSSSPGANTNSSKEGR